MSNWTTTLCIVIIPTERNRKLQSQRNALRDVLGEVAFRDGEVLPVKPQLGISGKGVGEACHGADELRENRAIAAPATPPANDRMNRRSSPTFRTVENSKNIRGVTESPIARRNEQMKL